MNGYRRAAWFVGCPVAAFVLAASALAQTESPSQAYLAFVAAAPKARSLKDLLPHLSTEYRSMLTAQPKDREAVWLQRLRDSVDMVDIKIEKETIIGAKCTLDGTAKNRKGVPLHGKVQMVKENDGWKLDEQLWST